MAVYLRIQPITNVESGNGSGFSGTVPMEGEKPRTTDPDPPPQFYGPLDEKAAEWPYAYFAKHGWETAGGYIHKLIGGVRHEGSTIVVPDDIRPLDEFVELSKG